MSIDKVDVKPLRKALQKFNEDLGVYINDDLRFKLGRVLTIIDAAISDQEQRKAIKDLINNEWWSGPSGNRLRDPDTMSNPHTDLRALCQVFDFELYDRPAGEPISERENLEYDIKRYRKVIATE